MDSLHKKYKDKEQLVLGKIYLYHELEKEGLYKEKWQEDALCTFHEKVDDSYFPCLFARKALKKGGIRYLFCQYRDVGEFIDFKNGVRDYIKEVKNVPLKARVLNPLVVFFENNNCLNRFDKQYDAAWEALNWIHNHDEEIWPKEVSLNPNEVSWSFCFNGVQLFINISSKHHRLIKSRNLGEYLTLVINPRENFDEIANVRTKSGRKIRETIRKRVYDYNDGYISDELGFYGQESNLEWLQYRLEEPGLPASENCPFLHSTKYKS